VYGETFQNTEKTIVSLEKEIREDIPMDQEKKTSRNGPIPRLKRNTIDRHARKTDPIKRRGKVAGRGWG